MSSFDPYQEWLGISPDGFHPDRYRLLGLPQFECDASAIARAADARLAHVRKFVGGEHATAAKKLVEELESARMSLLDATKKAIYDNLLKQQLASRAARAAAAEAEARAVGGGGTCHTTAKTAADAETRAAAPAVPARPTAPAAAVPMASAVDPSPPGPDADVDSLLPPMANVNDLLPPAAIPVAVAPAAFPHTMPQAVPTAMPAYPGMPQAVPVQPYGAPAYPQTAPAYPTAGPMAAQALPVQALPLGAYGAPMMAQALPVDPYGVPAPAYPPAGFGDPAYAAAPAAPEFVAGPSATKAALRRRKSTGGMLVMAVVVPVVLVGVVGMGGYLLKQQGLFDPPPAEQPGDGTTVASIDREPRLPPPSRPPLDVSPTQPAGAPPVSQPEKTRPGEEGPAEKPAEDMPGDDMPAEDMPADPDPEMKPEPENTPEPETNPAPQTKPGTPVNVSRALMAARYQMSRRNNLAIAKVRIDEAESAAATDAEKQEVVRVRAMLSYVEQFQNAVTESLKSLDGGLDFAYEDDRIGVVEKSANLLVLRIGGVNKEYKIDDLPSKLAVAIAENWFRKDDPAAKVAIGAFLVVHPKGDRDRARALWQQAQLEGLTDEVALVMPELEVVIPDELPDAPAEVPAVADDGRTAVPAADAQQAARDAVKQQFAADYEGAKDAATKSALADKLLTEAIGMEGSGDARYVLLAEALDLALQASDAGVIVRTVDALAESYAVDGWQLKVQSLEGAGKSAQTPEANASLARAALDLTDEAVVTEMYDIAGQLTKTALAAARKSKDGNLLKEASARNKEVAQMRAGS
jgi:hypothetical protein